MMTSRARTVVASVVLSGASCAGPAPSPVLEAPPPARVETPAASVEASPPLALSASAAPVQTAVASATAPAPPARCVSPNKPKTNGVVPDDLLTDPTPPKPSPGALERAARCVAALGHDGSPELASAKDCDWWSPTILALDPGKGRVAVLFAPEVPTAGGDCPALRGETIDLVPGQKSTTKTWDLSGTCQNRGLELSQYVDGLRARGFTVSAQNLVASHHAEGIGATGYRPLAVLDAPLCGWMLHVAPRSGRMVVTLVSPGNDAATELGAFPFERQMCHAFDHGKCVTVTEFAYPSVDEVVLSPDRKYLVASIAVTPGGHNEPLRYHIARYPLPASAAGALTP